MLEKKAWNISNVTGTSWSFKQFHTVDCLIEPLTSRIILHGMDLIEANNSHCLVKKCVQATIAAWQQGCMTERPYKHPEICIEMDLPTKPTWYIAIIFPSSDPSGIIRNLHSRVTKHDNWNPASHARLAPTSSSHSVLQQYTHVRNPLLIQRNGETPLQTYLFWGKVISLE